MAAGCKKQSKRNSMQLPCTMSNPRPPEKAPWTRAAAVCRRVCLLLLFLILFSCTQVPGSGKVIQKTFEVESFRNIFLVGQGNLELIQGPEEAVVAEAETNIMPRIQAYVENENLWIRFEKDSWPDVIRPTRPISYRVTFQNLETVTLHGMGNVHAARIDVPALLLQAHGSGKFRVDRLHTDQLSLRIHGSSEMVLAGTAAQQDLEINGSGWIRGEKLHGQGVRIRINGSGNVRLRADETLDVEINGSGKVIYTGQPEASTRVHGTGKIINQNTMPANS
jgi:hypothetical protein